MEILKAILFGIVEGITEWLPVSSTGHLILLDAFLKLEVTPEFYEMFQVVIQLGAILAVVVLFFRKLNPFSRQKTGAEVQKTWHLWATVALSVVPSAVLGLFLDDWLDRQLYNAVTVAVMLILYGFAFLFVEKRNEKRRVRIIEVGKIPWKTALFLGLFQALSLVPGTSRSGATILGALILGISRPAGAEFSFFMAIPTMLGASFLKLCKYLLEGMTPTPGELGILAVGCGVSFGVSLLVIKGLMRYVRNHSFRSFGVYRIVLGLAVLGYFLLQKAL